MLKKFTALFLVFVLVFSTTSVFARGNSSAFDAPEITKICENSFMIDGYVITSTTDRLGNLRSLTVYKNGQMLERVTISDGILRQEDFRNIDARVRGDATPDVKTFRMDELIYIPAQVSMSITPFTTGNLGAVRYQVHSGQHRLNFSSVNLFSDNLANREVRLTSGMLWGTALAVALAAIGNGLPSWKMAAVLGGVGFIAGLVIGFNTTIQFISGTHRGYRVSAQDQATGRNRAQTGQEFRGAVRCVSTGNATTQNLFSGYYPSFISRRSTDVAIAWFNQFWHEPFSVVW
ncbi:MAG: hypothetical protein FWB91_05030 [Defluviitaleaceae bacterium]|nr:hypothetical protein [Defluviitaleaceae bacterium]